MSASVQQALVDEALELSYQFRQNAALKNGLPDCRRVSAKVDEPAPAPPAPVINIDNHIPAAPAATDPPSPGATAAATVKDSFLRRAAPWLLLPGAAALGIGAGHLVRPATPISPPAVVQPTEQQKDGSLLQALQDRGLHLPGGTWPNQK